MPKWTAESVQAKKRRFRRRWKQITVAIGTTVFLWSTIGFTCFMIEEAIQQAGFGVFVLMGARPPPYEETLRAIESYEKLTNDLELFTRTIGWFNPFTYFSFMRYVEGCRANAQYQRAALILKIRQSTGAVVNQTKSEKPVVIDIQYRWENVTEEITLTPPANRTFLVRYQVDKNISIEREVTKLYVARDRYANGFLYIKITTKTGSKSIGRVSWVHVT